MNRKCWTLVALAVVFVACTAATDPGCEGTTAPQADSGVGKATVQVKTGSDGLTIEQRNVRDRLTADNKPGSIKHLYVLSAYSGQVLIYSTVRGKITSSGKRLSPKTIVVGASGDYRRDGYEFNGHATSEVLEDDGTYGDSVPYVYWFDAKGVYHQHYIEGGQILHVSDQPLAVKSVVLNMELTQQ